MSARPRAAAPLSVMVVVAAAAGLGGLGGLGGCKTDPEPPATLSREKLLDPETCKACHADHFREWSGSMHAYAAEDPVFIAMNKRGQRETGGALGDFCVKCHAPMAVREGATKDGLNLPSVRRELKGVTCFFCHSIDRVEGTHDAAVHLADDGVMRGAFADPVANTAHRAGYSVLHDRDKLESAATCGACHDIVNGHGTALERTYAEWQASVFSKAPGGATCGQCHMPQGQGVEPIANAPGVFARRRHAHGFPGVDLALTPFPEADAQKRDVKAALDASLQSALCVATAGGGQLRVMLDNVGAGHSFPSGASQDRRLWIEVTAYAAGAVLYQTGAVAEQAPITRSTDPDLWLLRECMFDGKGAEVHMFWEAKSTEGNALPGQVTFDPRDPRFYQTHIERRFPRTGTFTGVPDRVTMRVRMRPMGFDVLDDLVASGDLDPAVRAAMPTHEVGQPLEWTPSATEQLIIDRTPFTCVTNTNFNVQADRVPAKDRTRCKP